MTDTKTTTRIVIEDPALVEKVYTGKPGCCCGCNGKYSDSAASVRAHITRTNALIASGDVAEIDIDFCCGVFIVTETRYRNIYIRKDRALITKCGDLIVISARNSGTEFIEQAVAKRGR